MELDSKDCLRQIMAIHGVLGASLVDYTSGVTIDSTGRAPCDDAHVTATGVAGVVNAALHTAAFTSAGHTQRVDDIVLTAGNGYHVVHLLGRRPGPLLGVYVWLDRAFGNLAMTQRQLPRLAEALVTV
jgi:hypothetical protein